MFKKSDAVYEISTCTTGSVRVRELTIQYLGAKRGTATISQNGNIALEFARASLVRNSQNSTACDAYRVAMLKKPPGIAWRLTPHILDKQNMSKTTRLPYEPGTVYTTDATAYIDVATSAVSHGYQVFEQVAVTTGLPTGRKSFVDERGMLCSIDTASNARSEQVTRMAAHMLGWLESIAAGSLNGDDIADLLAVVRGIR